jgi:glycosyltransferase involved in cell wall biosynthesis
MRILVISLSFPPVADAEAYCSGKFVQALIDSGHETRVIFSSDVHRPPRVDQSSMWDSIKRVSFDMPLRSSIPRWKSLWLALMYQTTSWPRWTRSIVLKARELHSEAAFDLVISRSLPPEGHLAGSWVASDLGLPWVAIVNDPWDFSPLIPEETRPHWRTTLVYRIWWRRMLSKADRICFPCERLRNYCLRGSHRDDGVVVLPHIGAVSKSQNQDDGFLIVHSGRLGGNEFSRRSAAGLLHGLKELFRVRPAAISRTRLVFVGPEDPQTVQLATSLGLAESVCCTGLVSYEKSLGYIAQASLCVLVERDLEEGVFFPSKLGDYISARKPVLALSPAVGCVADLATERGVQRVGPSDTPAIAAALVEMFDAFVEHRLESYAPSDLLVSRHEGNRVIGEFLNVVSPLTLKAQ